MVVNLLLGNDHELLDHNPDVTKDDEGWYVLEDFKFSPETFVCEETHRVYFTEFLFNEDFVHEVCYVNGRRAADLERTHMRQ
jgi:hypothetical protein